jgi:tetratricopeptide (TPR) repeat protein
MPIHFSYSFAPPHRLTVALPDSSHKTLLDCQPGNLRMAWSYDNLLDKPLASLIIPKTEWEVVLKPEIDRHHFAQTSWKRLGLSSDHDANHDAPGWLPVLDYLCQEGSVYLRMIVVGAQNAAIIRIDSENQDSIPHQVTLVTEKPGGWSGQNPAWVQADWDADVLLAGWAERADRIIVFQIGGDTQPVIGPTSLTMSWEIAPGETRQAWIIRPYRAYHSSLPVLRRKDWQTEFDQGIKSWLDLIDRATQITLPDRDIQAAFYAGLADCFVMREPVADGTIAGCPGTELYRAAAPYEPAILAILLDQVGLHEEAAAGYQMCLDQQGADGNWADPQGWAHGMWGTGGMKAWFILEHYRQTGDRQYLEANFPHLLANSGWQERQRQKTRYLIDGQRPLTYGLMPRGMGDGGLMGEDGTFYGVFYPHNFFAVYADALALEAAHILNKTSDIAELEVIYQKASADLLLSLELGGIQEEDYRWIPGVPGHTVGSRWGALYSVFPCGILANDHPLVTGTLLKIESQLSPGGIPLNTGWLKDGMWVAITLDNLAEVLLRRGEADRAIAYLSATLEHGTPLLSWCEERGPEPNSSHCTGDRQHLWTPLAVSRFLRDALVMEAGETLHLAWGTERTWLISGRQVGVKGMSTYFGPISYEIRCDPADQSISGWIDLTKCHPPQLKLHLRLPAGKRLINLTSTMVVEWNAAEESLTWEKPVGRSEFRASTH